EVAGAGLGIALRGRTITPAARQADLHEVTGLEHLLGFGLLGRAPIDEHLAAPAGPAAEEALGRDARAIAEHGAAVSPAGPHAEGDVLAEPAAEAAVAAGIGSQRLALDHEWGERLDHFRGGAEDAGGGWGGGGR